MSKESLVTSVRQRLQHVAKELERDFNSVQLSYVQERFLYRLSKSVYKNVFILKGALLFVAYDVSTLRPTKDIDFLSSLIANNSEDLKEIVKEICTIEYNDAVSFDKESTQATEITTDKEYHGTRVKLISKLGTARITLSLDFGFGDKIIAGPVEIEFPTLLDFEAPQIKVYSLESAIAEKFQACVKLNFETSRMKDFYDINELATHNSFNQATLMDAIKETFSARETEIDDKSVIFANKFKKDENKEIQWKAFLRRTSLPPKFSFKEIIERIEMFLNIYNKGNAAAKEWDNAKWEWKESKS